MPTTIIILIAVVLTIGFLVVAGCADRRSDAGLHGGGHGGHSGHNH